MAANYSIVHQTPKTQAVPGGTFVPAMEVTFTTKPHGIVGKVTIPQSQYAPANVDKIVSKEAETIEAVQDL